MIPGGVGEAVGGIGSAVGGTPHPFEELFFVKESDGTTRFLAEDGSGQFVAEIHVVAPLAVGDISNLVASGGLVGNGSLIIGPGGLAG